ncbi:hypothetical protein ZWY2020_044774 [Hordeum vulgare]|nr:hypothetical protein ZWY2020_044774 [Hordeum vulgare]
MTVRRPRSCDSPAPSGGPPPPPPAGVPALANPPRRPLHHLPPPPPSRLTTLGPPQRLNPWRQDPVPPLRRAPFRRRARLVRRLASEAPSSALSSWTCRPRRSATALMARCLPGGARAVLHLRPSRRLPRRESFVLLPLPGRHARGARCASSSQPPISKALKAQPPRADRIPRAHRFLLGNRNRAGLWCVPVARVVKPASKHETPPLHCCAAAPLPRAVIKGEENSHPPCLQKADYSPPQVPNHLVAVCTRERHPKRPPRSFLQASTPSPTPLNPPAPPAAVCAAAEMDGVGLGDPSLRTEEDTCYIATSYDLDRARLDWESSAIVAWTLSAPSGADRSDVEDVFCRKYRLRPSELVVSSHFPEQYIVKFSSAELRDQVMRTERCCFKLDGLDVHFRPWRAVSHGYNADLHYRAHVLVDGLPPFAWRPEIVDQLVGRNCAVQRFDDGFTTMEVTSSFGMWVWTPSPRRIAKAMWCTFVNKAPCGLSSRIRIGDGPDQWKRA